MVNAMEKNSQIILRYLNKNEHVTLTEMVKKISLSRGQIRVAVAFLLGAKKIIEVNIGMAKVYNLK